MTKKRLTAKQKQAIRKLMNEKKYSREYATMLVLRTYEDVEHFEIGSEK